MRLNGLRDVARDDMAKFPRICKDFCMTRDQDVGSRFSRRARPTSARSVVVCENATQSKSNNDKRVRQLSTPLADRDHQHADRAV